MRFNTTLIPFTTLIFITIINIPTTLSRRLNQKFTKSNHPQTILKKGYSVTTDSDGNRITDATKIEKNATIISHLQNGKIKSTVL